MSLGIPNSAQVILDRMIVDAQSVLPSLSPSLRESGIRALLTAFAGASLENFLTLEILLQQVFLNTATIEEFIAVWASYKNIPRNPAAASQGFITASGVSTTIIPMGTLWATQDGIQFETLASATILTQSLSVTSINRVSNVATVLTASDHLLASGISVTISGAVQPEYNGTFVIDVISSDQFTYTVTGVPATPATGTILSTFTTASVEVRSTTTGLLTQQPAGVALTISSPIPGVDNTAFVQFGALGGGTDIETLMDWRTRILFEYQNPSAPFNVANIIAQARKVPGVTRVFVKEITPAIGQVTIYFTRDNDASIIPDFSEVLTVRNKILEIKSATTAAADIFVLAPVPLSIDFSFSSIMPDTPTMRTAITDVLNQFFRERTQVGLDVLRVQYESAINGTIDITTGTPLESFVLSSPVADVSIGTNEIGILGTVMF